MLGGIAYCVVRVSWEPRPLASAKWETKNPLPTGMFAAHAVVARGSLFVIGGAHEATTLETCFVYSGADDRWAARPALPKTDDGEPGRYSGAVAVLGEKIYLAGGWRKNPPLPTDTLLVYDVKGARWMTGAAPLPTRSGSSAAAALGDRLYVLTGWDGVDGFPKCFFAYDTVQDRWHELKPPPHGHIDPAMAAIDGKLYVAGGADAHGPTGALDVYEPATGLWTSKTSMPTPRSNAGSAIFTGKLYVAGGSNKSGPLATVECYDPSADKWTTFPSLSTPRTHVAAAVLENMLYVLGGNNGSRQVESLRLER